MTSHFAVFIKSLIFMQIFIFCLIVGVSIDINSYYLSHNPFKQMQSFAKPFSSITLDEKIYQNLFKKTSFVLAGSANNINARDYMQSEMPQQFLTAHIQALAYMKTENILGDMSPDQFDKMPPVSDILLTETNTAAVDYEKFKQYQVMLYCTHSSESYIPDSGTANLNGGRLGLVNQVAAQIADSLKFKGIKAELVETVHDYPDYNLSYTNSRATVKNILESSNHKLLLFDIHRDSIPGLTEAQRVKINGKNAAPILIIVGTDERKEHPNWKKNLTFAKTINAIGEKKYPDLIKGIRTKAGTYNQEFHPQSLLLELGSDYNSMEEASYSAELLADIIAEMLREEEEQ